MRGIFHETAYSDILPKIKGMEWIKELFDFVQDATPMAKTTFYTLMNDKIMAKQEDYLLDKTPDARSAMEEAVKEIEKELSNRTG